MNQQLQLLPSSVFEGDRIKKAVVKCSLVTVLVVAGLLMWFKTTREATQSMTAQAEAAAGFQGQIAALDGQISALQSDIAPVDSRHDYILALKDYGDNWPRLMRELAGFIYARVELLSCQLDTQGFSLSVRTKTTEDVARLLQNLKQSYAAGLVQQDSLNVTGLTGWPNATSPLGYGLAAANHIDIAIGDDYARLQAVGSNANPEEGPGLGLAGLDVLSGSGAMPTDLGPAPGSGGSMAGEPGMEGSMDPAMDSGMDGMGGMGGQATQAGSVDSDRLVQLAIAKYIQPSVDPPPQPYLNLTITGRWAAPLQEPVGNMPAGAGGAGGSPDMMMDDPGMMEGPPAEDTGSSPAGD